MAFGRAAQRPFARGFWPQNCCTRTAVTITPGPSPGMSSPSRATARSWKRCSPRRCTARGGGSCGGWTQQRVAAATGASQQTVSFRLAFHRRERVGGLRLQSRRLRHILAVRLKEAGGFGGGFSIMARARRFPNFLGKRHFAARVLVSMVAPRRLLARSSPFLEEGQGRSCSVAHRGMRMGRVGKGRACRRPEPRQIRGHHRLAPRAVEPLQPADGPDHARIGPDGA